MLTLSLKGIISSQRGMGLVGGVVDNSPAKSEPGN
jgi:hypothetical protein